MASKIVSCGISFQPLVENRFFLDDPQKAGFHPDLWFLSFSFAKTSVI